MLHHPLLVQGVPSCTVWPEDARACQVMAWQREGIGCDLRNNSSGRGMELQMLQVGD